MSEEAGQTAAPGVSSARKTPRSNVSFSDLIPRALWGVVLTVLALGTAFSDGISFLLFWWAAAIAIHWEWQRLVGGVRQIERLIAGVAVITAANLFVATGHLSWCILTLAVGTLATAALGGRRSRGIVGAGVLYAGSLPIALTLLRASAPFGLEAILWLFAVVWGTDVMAYFGGRIIGGPKLWPRLSPSKTWSGFLVGVGTGALAGLAVASGSGAHGPLVALGIAAGAIAQGGDLFESSLKRRFGVKDTSHIIPGHGGVMDRLDGFLAAAVFAACFGVIRFGIHSPAAGLLQW